MKSVENVIMFWGESRVPPSLRKAPIPTGPLCRYPATVSNSALRSEPKASARIRTDEPGDDAMAKAMTQETTRSPTA